MSRKGLYLNYVIHNNKYSSWFQVQQISNPNKYEDDLLRTDLVKSFQYPNKHNSYGDKDNLETSILYRDDNIKVRIEELSGGGSNTDNVIIKDVYSVDVNDNSEHNVIDESESVKYVDDYLQSAVNSQVIDRFDKQVIGKINFVYPYFDWSCWVM